MAALASIVSARVSILGEGLSLSTGRFCGRVSSPVYHGGTVPGIYLALVAAAAAVTTVSAARGTRAALAEP